MRVNAERFHRPRTEIQHLIDEWIFHKRNREILAERLFDHTPYEVLAEKYSLSVQQTKEIFYKAFAIIEAKL